MKRKSIILFIAGTAIVVSLLAYKAVNARRAGSDTTNVTINGRSFNVGNHSLNSRTALKREFAKFGIDLPEAVNLDEIRSVKPVILENPLSARKKNQEKALQAPEGLKAEHRLKLSGESGAVELVMGSIKKGSVSAAARLEADRWTRAEIAGDRNFPKIFRKSRGKETDIVCLDEKKGVFLMLRRVER